MLLLSVLFFSGLAALAPGGSSLRLPRQAETDGLQNMVVVTWDEYSLIINGSRVNVFSGDVHPYRSKSPSRRVSESHGSIAKRACKLTRRILRSLGFNAGSTTAGSSQRMYVLTLISAQGHDRRPRCYPGIRQRRRAARNGGGVDVQDRVTCTTFADKHVVMGVDDLNIYGD
ncbi:hypothetical protein DFH07DRAFT_940794, partial [Mycena maculata]